tara:strand:- start:5 stop:289 length:285 start_codon:yes stop_codon:yes gene_type:complete
VYYRLVLQEVILMSDDITGVRILIIDDSSTHVAVCRKLLLTAGVDPYFIYEAQSVKQAKKTIKDTPPDICFIDYILPDGLGSEVQPFQGENLSI